MSLQLWLSERRLRQHRSSAYNASQKQRAIESYRNSLEVNPRNTGGQETLMRLESRQ
jgi:hypothetical protein